MVLNAPVESPADAEVTSIRDMVGVPADVPLVVYGGGVNPARGLHTMVQALPALPGVYFAIVSRGNSVTEELLKLAGQLGVGERVRLAPYVDPEFVPRYLESASVGISPLLRAPNHDIAITNKFCEYIAAGLPIVTSDTPAQAQLVNALDLGVVYRQGMSRTAPGRSGWRWQIAIDSPTGSFRTPRCGTGSPGQPKPRRCARCTRNSWESCLPERGIPAQRRSTG